MIDSFFQHRGVNADTHDTADSDKFPRLVCLCILDACMEVLCSFFGCLFYIVKGRRAVPPSSLLVPELFTVL